MKRFYFFYLFAILFNSSMCPLWSQETDSASTDSISPFPQQSLLPPANLPGTGIAQFGVKPKSDYSAFLKLGKPYQPNIDFHRMDLRGTSNYTPPWVQKEHVIDMGRDPGTFWLSPYTVALMGLAMLERYYLREHLTDMFAGIDLKPENLFAVEPYWQILEALWDKSPQTINELSTNPRVGFRFQGRKLEDAINKLIENKLVNSELLTNKSLQFEPTVDKMALEKKIIQLLNNDKYTGATVRDGLNDILEKYYIKKNSPKEMPALK